MGSVEKNDSSQNLSDLMDQLEFDVDELKRSAIGLNPADNDDSWMDVSKEDLDNMLTNRFGNVVLENGTTNIAEKLNSFINHVSDVEGVEFPNLPSSSQGEPKRPPRAKNKRAKCVNFAPDTKGAKDDGARVEKVVIEPDGFMQAVKNILDFSIPDDNSYWESDGSGMSSYDEEEEMELDDMPRRNKKMSTYFKQMDQELATTTMGQSFVKKSAKVGEKAQEKFDDVEEFEPVDIDMNALKNIIMSYKTQMGEAGPSENILGPLGVNLQDIDADVD